MSLLAGEKEHMFGTVIRDQTSEVRLARHRTEQDETGEAGSMRAILALLADEREARIANDKGARRTEVLLADAGFSTGDIASLLGKSYEAVKSTLRRERAK
jgi:DNA-directed RNA polymerase specialized sigma24 family protein